MSDKVLIDTNLWVYLYAKSPETKYFKVKQLVETNFDNIIFSAQIIGELYHVLTKKNFCAKEEAKDIIVEVTTAFSVIAIDTANVLKALDINNKTGYSYWDSLVFATALLNDCRFLYSEDMQHNQIIENKTRIINPFGLTINIDD